MRFACLYRCLKELGIFVEVCGRTACRELLEQLDGVMMPESALLYDAGPWAKASRSSIWCF